MCKKAWIIGISAAVGAAGIFGVIYNSKGMRTKRMIKSAGKIIYTVGGMLQTLSCYDCLS